MHIDDVKLLEFPDNDRWSVSLSKIHDLSPDATAEVTGLDEGWTVWDLVFVDDLFQATSVDKRHVLDVGWSPGGDPTGRFLIRLIEIGDSSNAYGWNQPLFRFDTRSVAEVARLLQAIMAAEDLSAFAGRGSS